jgi:hypothetical protein
VLKTTAAAFASLALLIAVGIAGASGVLAPLTSQTGTQPSRTAMQDIPPEQFALYDQAAATCPGLDWTILAAIGKIESDHGRSTDPGVHRGHNHKGAMVICRSVSL